MDSYTLCKLIHNPRRRIILKNTQLIAIIFVIAFISEGCGHSAGQYHPIVDGPEDEKYFTDLNNCQQLATKRSYVNDDVKTNALLGAGLGAVAGGIEEGWEGAVGGSTRSWETRTEKKNIIIECMRLRGHRVVEITSHY